MNELKARALAMFEQRSELSADEITKFAEEVEFDGDRPNLIASPKIAESGLDDGAKRSRPN